MDINNYENDIIEFDHRYTEIEFMLAKADSNNDPLNSPPGSDSTNWNVIIGYCHELLEMDFDCRVVLWLLRAELNTKGFMALFSRISDIELQFEKWKSSNTDEYTDKYHNVSIELSWLASHQCLSLVKNSVLTPDSTITLDVLLNQNKDIEQRSLHYSQIVLTIANTNMLYQQLGLPTLAKQLSYIEEALIRIEDFSNDKHNDYRLDCRQLRHYLSISSHFISSLNQTEETIYPEGNEVQTNEIKEIYQSYYELKNRHDVILTLDKVLEYFERNEPSHPAPILIRRSQKMIGMDFAAIVENMLPEALSSLQQFTGK